MDRICCYFSKYLKIYGIFSYVKWQPTMKAIFVTLLYLNRGLLIIGIMGARYLSRISSGISGITDFDNFMQPYLYLMIILKNQFQVLRINYFAFYL